jgi:hypothetical protein
MEWNRSITLALAKESCQFCKGMGLATETQPCRCVLRAIYRKCFTRFRSCIEMDKLASTTKRSGNLISRPNEEYTADFLSVTRKALTDDEYKLFKFHVLLRADWQLCVRKTDFKHLAQKQVFFREVYKIQEKLGRRYAELQPHALYPLNEYFEQAPRKLRWCTAVA